MSFQLQRLGIVMEPEPGNPDEIEVFLTLGLHVAPTAALPFSAPRCAGQFFAHWRRACAVQRQGRSGWR